MPVAVANLRLCHSLILTLEFYFIIGERIKNDKKCLFFLFFILFFFILKETHMFAFFSKHIRIMDPYSDL